MKKTLALLLVLAMALSFCGCASSDYKKAVELYDRGELDSARDIFEQLGGYKDSAAYVEEINKSLDYDRAVKLYDEGSYEQARTIFEGLGDYEQSAAYLTDCADRLIEAEIVGSWTSDKIDVSALVLSGMESAGYEEFFESYSVGAVNIGMVLELNEDGSFRCGINESSLAEFSEGVKTLFVDFTKFVIDAELKAAAEDMGTSYERLLEGLGVESVEDAVMQVYGMDLEELAELMLAEENFAQLFEEMEYYGQFSSKAAKISLISDDSEETAEYDAASGVLTVTGEGIDDFSKVLYPISFKKA